MTNGSEMTVLCSEDGAACSQDVHVDIHGERRWKSSMELEYKDPQKPGRKLGLIQGT